MNNVSLHLAAVERHLRNDEESSVETGVSTSFWPDTSENHSPEKDFIRRKRLNSIEGQCSTPPRLERRNRSEPRLSSTYELSPAYDGTLCMPSPLKSPLGDLDTLGSRMMGMSVFMSQPGAADQQKNDDTLSLSSDSSLDSDQELERKAWEIREDLRVSQLIEIAAVAERAAAAGCDSFTGLASTFGGDDGKKELCPLQMQRNHTYTEGQQGLSTPVRAPYVLRRTQTTGRKRGQKKKIPVMALRHIDDLIPPMKQLHLHLRSHLYRSGVETENSLVDEPVEFGLIEKKEQQGHEGKNADGSPSNVSFIQKMKRWVSTTSSIGEEENKSAHAGDNERDGIELGENKLGLVDDFIIGDRLSEQITSPAIASGIWKASPVKMPSGLIPPDELDYVNEATPSYRRQPSSPEDKMDQKTISTEPTLSSEESQLSPYAPDGAPHTNIIPVALFNSDGDIDKAVAVGDVKLGSRLHPKPFRVRVRSCSEPYVSVLLKEQWAKAAPSSPKIIPNLYITPVRLKGMRDRRLQGRSSQSKISLAWGTFTSEKVTTPVAGERQRGSFANPDLAKSDSNLPIDFSEKAKSFLRPRSMSVGQIIDSISIGITQAAGESTHDPSDFSTVLQETKPSDISKSDTSLVLTGGTTVVPAAQAINRRWQNITNFTPERNPNPVFETPTGTPERVSKVQQVVAFEASQSDSLRTPEPSYQCLTRSQIAWMDSESTTQQHESTMGCKTDTNENQEPTAPLVGFRRTTSCPSLIDTFDIPDFGRLSPATLKTETKKSILKVFERLSPKLNRPNERNLYYSSGENHGYLNNYLYCGKPGQEKKKEKKNNKKLPDPPLQPFCGEHVPCAAAVAESCDVLNSVSETATFFFQPIPTKKESDYALIFETASSSDFSAYAEGPETWFAAASEKFDGALERLVGSADRTNTKWMDTFKAPTLHIKTPQSARKNRNSSIECNQYDPRKVQGIILVRESRTPVPTEDPPSIVPIGAQFPPPDADASDETFGLMYGITRSQFRSLSKDERHALWQKHQGCMVINIPSLAEPVPDIVKSPTAPSPSRKAKVRKAQARLAQRRLRSALSM